MKAIPILLILLLAACSTADQPSTDASKVAPEGIVQRITEQETALTDTSVKVFDKRKALELYAVYLEFVEKYPQDTMAPEYLFRAARMAKPLHKSTEAITLCDRIIKEYPNWRVMPAIWMMKGITYQDELLNKDSARVAYEQIVARYPGTRYAEDAKAMIENLQYSDEELIERFKQMNPPEEEEQAQGR
jgi:outer membrane protein assembly factor BamD (BamD/ComL family)